MVEVWLPYGRTEVCVRVPTSNLLGIIEPNEGAKAEDPQAEIENALTNPIGKERLADFVKTGDTAALVLEDFGASTNRVVALEMLKELSVVGIKEEEVTVILANDPLITSSFREDTYPLGEDISSKVKIIGHNREDTDHVFVGETSKGTDVYLNRVFAEADVKIIAGVVRPHPFAGYSGGRECVLPGISGDETVKQNLSLSLSAKSARGLLEGNAVHEDMAEAARLAEVDFTLNIVRNKRLEVVRAFAGDLNRAFHESVKLADEIYRITAKGPADITFVSPGGLPFDASLFEAAKSIDAAVEAVKRDKVIVLVAECLEGFGNRDFYEDISNNENTKDLERSLRKSFTVGGLMAHRLMECLQRYRIVLVSVMPDYYISGASGMKSARTVNEAFRIASDIAGKNDRVSFIPYGNSTMPLIRTAG